MSGSAPTRRRRSTCISASGRGSGLPAAIADRGGLRRGHRLSRVPLRRRRRLFRDPHHRLRRVRAHRLRPFQLGRRLGRAVPAGRATTRSNDLWNLRGSPIMFYYVMLALTVAAFVLCHALLRSRIGYYWLAIREDEEAARALGINTFRYKMYRGGDLRRHDLARRRVLRVLLQQPVSRAGLPHLALDRDHPRPDHRRHRHAVRPDRRRVPADRPCRELMQELLARVRRRRARRQAGVLRRLPAGGGHGPARRRLAVARPASSAWTEPRS